ncbi:hypothetical protein AAY473_030918, partial [Plecturocebus cupreus]
MNQVVKTNDAMRKLSRPMDKQPVSQALIKLKQEGRIFANHSLGTKDVHTATGELWILSQNSEAVGGNPLDTMFHPVVFWFNYLIFQTSIKKGLDLLDNIKTPRVFLNRNDIILSPFCFEPIFPEGTGSNKGETLPHHSLMNLRWFPHWQCFIKHFSTVAQLLPTVRFQHMSQQHPGADASQPELSPPPKSSKEVPCIASSCFDDLQTYSVSHYGSQAGLKLLGS